MAKTPYTSLSSEDILAGHISGIQSDVNKIQDVLDMKTGTKSGHALNAVSDQEDVTLRYRIYEATERNWLSNPEPVIFKNGTEVSSSEYVLHAPYGVVVFNEQLSSSDNVTADFTHIIGESNKIETIENEITNIDTSEGKLPVGGSSGQILAKASNANYDTEWINESTGGGGTTKSIEGTVPFFMYGGHLTHMRQDYNPIDSNGDYDASALKSAFNILTLAESLDVFPLPIDKEITIKQAGIMSGDGTAYDVRVRIGLYKDNGNLYPSELVFDTDDIIVSPDTWGYDNVNITLEAGLYWIARHNKSDTSWNGLNQHSAISLQEFDAEKFLKDFAEPLNPFTVYGGYRTDVAWSDNGNLPDPFPSGVSPFKRNTYGSPWLVLDDR